MQHLSTETNISLSFLPGNHNLDGELSPSHIDNFSMKKVIGSNGTVFVECGSQSGRFNISETTFAMIKDLHFFVLIIEDTIFEGVEGRGTALVLNEVVDASIENSYCSESFHSNVHASTFELAQYQQCYFFCR